VSEHLSIRLNDEATAVVKDMADAHGVSMSDIIREAIVVYRFIDGELAAGRTIESVGPDGERHKVTFVFGEHYRG
jgi:predicted transcriptional regulator